MLVLEVVLLLILGHLTRSLRLAFPSRAERLRGGIGRRCAQRASASPLRTRSADRVVFADHVVERLTQFLKVLRIEVGALEILHKPPEQKHRLQVVLPRQSHLQWHRQGLHNRLLMLALLGFDGLEAATGVVESDLKVIAGSQGLAHVLQQLETVLEQVVRRLRQRRRLSHHRTSSLPR